MAETWELDRRHFLRLSALACGGVVLGSGAAGMLAGPAFAQEWTGWPGGRPADAQAFRWGVNELWWYGHAQVFSRNAEIQYRAEDVTSFWVRGRARRGGPPGHRPPSDRPIGPGSALYGVRIQWGRPLSAGHAYRFTARMTDPQRLPDLITVNDAVVWRRADGYDGSDFEVRFVYVPATDEPATICFIRAATDDWTAIYPPHQGQWVDHNLFSQQSAGPEPRPDYEMLRLPGGTRFTGIEPHLASAYFVDTFGGPVAYQRPPLPALPYPPAEVTFLERGFGLGTLPQYAGYVATAAPQTLTFQPGRSQPAAARTFADWAGVAAQGGVRDVIVTPVREESPGVFVFQHLNGAIAGAGTPQEKEQAAARIAAGMAAAARHWLQLVPGSTVYLFHVEMNAAWGNYAGGVAHSNIAGVPGYEAIAEGGAQAWPLSFDFFRNFRAQVEAAIGADAGRVRWLGNFDRTGFQGAYAHHSGVDVALHKNIHRQSINIMSANSRGAAHAYGKDYGYDFDLFDRQYAFSHHPDSVRHGLQVMFHGGARYLMDEIRVNAWQPQNHEHVSSWGETWLDFQRYVRTHPRLGAPQVRIAFMRGMGDEWNRMAGRSSSWEAVSWMPTAEMNDALARPTTPDKWLKARRAVEAGSAPSWRDIYFSDYDLLNLVFAGFGNPRRTEPDRLTTGTPYGPVDLVPWDTPLDVLSTYDLVVYLGRAADTPQFPTRANLSNYVKGGGTLVLAAGQLKREDGEFDFDFQWLGVRFTQRRMLAGLPYTLIELVSPEAEVLQTLPNGDPYVVRSPDQNGVAYVLSGEWMTYFDHHTPRGVLEPLLESVRWLQLDPTSDWLEYMVQRKGQTVVFPLFNHGRGWFPSGNGIDRGAWSGTVGVDLSRLGLAGTTPECFRAVVSPDATAPVTLEPLDHTLSGDLLQVDVSVPQLEELVIGPASSAEADYFA